MNELSAKTSPPSQASPSPGLRNVPGAKPGRGRGSTTLDPEGALDLLPDRERKEQGDEDEDCQQDEEADAGALDLAGVLDPGPAASAGLRERA
jgi:hypothetical protein